MALELNYQTRSFAGEFYRYDNTIPLGAQNNSVMADQLSGYWFLRIGGAPPDAVSHPLIRQLRLWLMPLFVQLVIVTDSYSWSLIKYGDTT